MVLGGWCLVDGAENGLEDMMQQNICPDIITLYVDRKILCRRSNTKEVLNSIAEEGLTMSLLIDELQEDHENVMLLEIIKKLV